MNPFISEIIPGFSLEKCKNACKDKVYIGIDFGTSTTVVSCCYWDEKSDELKIEELNLDQLPSNPPVKTHLIPTVVYIDKNKKKFITGQEAKLRRVWPDTEVNANYFSSFKMELGKDIGASYHRSILLKDKKLAKKVVESIGAILPSDTDYNTIDDLLIDLIDKLSDSLAGEIPKKDIIDNETGDILIPKGKPVTKFKIKSAARRFKYWKFETRNNLPKVQTIIKRFIKKYAKLEGGNDDNPNGEYFIIDRPWKAAAAFLKSIKPKIEKECNNRFPGKDIFYTASIPATFGSNQRRDLLEALECVGINIDIKLLIDEPNAAFISWLCSENDAEDLISRKSNILVFDFGAGTCDTSLLSSEFHNGKLNLKNLSLSSFTALGGDDLDRKIAETILFPQICDENNLDKLDISPINYKNYFELPLISAAENLKVAASQKLKRSPFLNDSENHISINESVVVDFKDKKYLLSSPVLSFEEFGDCVRSFIQNSDGEDEYKSLLDRINPFKRPEKTTIFDLIDETLRKAELKKSDIDYLLFIGGSSNLPQIGEEIENYFDEGTLSIYPQDMQSHVSKGVAFHSFLSHGININPITDILAETIFLRLQEGQTPILKSGTEIPVSKDVLGFRTLDASIRKIEMPFYAGSEEDDNRRRVIQKVEFELPKNYDHEEEIFLKLSVDHNKLVELEAYYGKELLIKETLNPLANIALDKYSTEVGRLSTKINNQQAEDKYFHYYINELIELHTQHGNHAACLALYEEHFEDEYTSLCYHASNAGEDKLKTKYAHLAYKQDQSGLNCYNLAIQYPRDEPEYRKYMKEAVDKYGSEIAKYHYGKLIKVEDPERSEELINEAFNYYKTEFENDPTGLSAWQYSSLLNISYYLDDEETRDKVKEARIKLSKQIKGDEISHVHENLLTRDEDIKLIDAKNKLIEVFNVDD